MAPTLLEGVDVSSYPILSHPTVMRAAEFAAAAHEGQFRRTGEAYVTHTVETARIIAGLVPPMSSRSLATVVAAVLHDTVDDTETSQADLARDFGPEVADIVVGVTRLSQLNQLLRRQRRLELVEGAWASPQPRQGQAGVPDGGLTASDGAILRSLILSMVDDPRTLLIKLADRLHNMRTLYALQPDKARAVASETLGVWCSLAARLGVWAIKSELDDLCFAVLMPATFLRLKNSLDAIWSGAEAPPQELDDEALFAALEAQVPPAPGDQFLSADQRRMRALLSCVLPFDLLTPQMGTSMRLPSLAGRAPASAAAALDALATCQRALRDELRLSAVTPGLEVTVQGRLKSLWSTHLKMQRKNCSAVEVYDARALRVVVEDPVTQDPQLETEACYSLLSAVHRLWKPVSGELDDYIARPKPSGYRSLHTAVRAPDGASLEVQLRTKYMHINAEYGSAAHWLYKDPAPPGPSQAPPSTPPILSAAVAAVEPFVRALATADGGPAARAAADFVAEHKSSETLPALADGPPDAPARRAPASSGGHMQAGSPLLRVDSGRLNDAVVITADEPGIHLLVAYQLGDRARRFGTSEATDYSALSRLVAEKGWHSAGQGDFRVCLEQFVLCSDGRYHKLDAYGRKLDVFVELLNVTADTPGASAPLQAPGAGEDPQNDKVRLLRSLLTWEQDLIGDQEVAQQAEPQPAQAASPEVLCIIWPQGATLRLAAGTTAGAVAERYGPPVQRVMVNDREVAASTVLQDGDILLL